MEGLVENILFYYFINYFLIVELRERLLEIGEKEQRLLKEKEDAETPEQKKVKLLEQVKKNNEEIAVMQKQSVHFTVKASKEIMECCM